MPFLSRSTYPGPPRYQFNGHLQTILPALTRRISVPYERERLTLSDGDFLDLDWLVQEGRQRLALLTHGLEGNTDRHYMKGMAQYFFRHGWDVLGWNCRSCSGELNRARRLYNHGEIGDIGEVIAHALQTKNYQEIVLIGFSMGGSITMKYLGVHGKQVPDVIRTGIAFSSPCDLAESVAALALPGNGFYRRRFYNSLKAKITAKAIQHPGLVDLSNFERIQEWRDFDNYFSAPINGYRDAEDFYYQASAQHFMGGIRRRVLLVNAVNDPILPPACTPVELCREHPSIFLEMPRRGGHVGFARPGGGPAWSELRALEFVERG